jgi:hypothetical protein
MLFLKPIFYKFLKKIIIMKVKFLMSLLVATSFVFALTSCEELENLDPNSPCDFPELAHVKDMTGLDGCGLMLVMVLDSTKIIEPVGTDLKGKGFKDGDLVLVGVNPIQPLVASTCMAGTPAELLCIEKFAFKPK